MRSWQRLVAIGTGALASLWGFGTALAQGEPEGVVPVLRDVILNVAGRMDAKLGTWVAGNALTEPEGQGFINDLASFIRQLVSYVAEALGDLLVELNFM